MSDMDLSDYQWLVIAGGFVCFAMAWGIGANDVANAFATSVGARAITLKQATIIAGIFEFAGAFLLGSEVTDTVRKGITNYSEFEGQEDILLLGMFCALCSSSLWLYIATRFSMPVSTTQSIVGSIIGFAMVVHGSNAVVWEKVQDIAIFWLASPIGSGIFALMLFVPTRNLVLRRPDAYEFLLKIWPIYVWIVVFIMTLFLLFKGLKRIDYEATWSDALWIAAVCGIAVALIAWLAAIKSGKLVSYVENKVKEDEKWNNEREKLYRRYSISTSATITSKNGENTTKDDKDSTISMKPVHVAQDSFGIVTPTTPTPHDTEIEVLNGGGGNNNNVSNASITPSASTIEHEGESSKFGNIASKLTKGVNVDVHDDLEIYELQIEANAEHFDPRVERSFNWLQVTSASLDIFAHGSNDVANAVAPFAAMIALYETAEVSAEVSIPWWVSFIGAAGMVIGLATYGYKIIKAIGVRLVCMSSTRGYSIELASALMVIIASYYGYPASTTHCQIGATVGIGCLEAQRNAQDGNKLIWKTIVNWKLLAIVFLGWIFTVLVSACTCALIFSFMAYTPSLNCD